MFAGLAIKNDMASIAYSGYADPLSGILTPPSSRRAFWVRFLHSLKLNHQERATSP